MTRRARRVLQREDGRKALFVILGIGAFTMALVVLAWWTLTSAGSPSKAATTMATAPLTDAAGETIPAPSPTTYMAPTPSYVTPALTAPLGTLEPPLPESSAILTEPTAAPPTTAAPPPPPPPPPAPVVSNVKLDCQLAGKRGVRAVLSLTASQPVPVSVTAADKTETKVVVGSQAIGVSAQVDGKQQAVCRADVNGQAVGPIPAR